MIIILCVIFPLILSILLVSIVIPRILLVSYKKKLFDIPNNRKVHKNPVPRLGGVSFFPVLLIVLSVSMGARYSLDCPILYSSPKIIFIRFMFLIVGLTMLYLIGLLDDLISVGYRRKFLIQIISAVLMPLSGMWINSLNGLFGVYSLSGWIGIPLTIFIVIYITNSINLIDGIDGLASGLSAISLAVLGVICFYYGQYIYGTLAFSMLGILIPFWIYNVYGRVEKCRKIFMGDAGSLTLGYIISFIIIHLCMHENVSFPSGMSILVFSTLIIPLLDVVRVVLARIRDKRNPFLPDKNHIHHKLLRTGMRIRWAMISLLLISLLFITINAILIKVNFNVTLLFILNIILWIMMHFIINIFIAKRENKIGKKWYMTYFM